MFEDLEEYYAACRETESEESDGSKRISGGRARLSMRPRGQRSRQCGDIGDADAKYLDVLSRPLQLSPQGDQSRSQWLLDLLSAVAQLPSKHFVRRTDGEGWQLSIGVTPSHDVTWFVHEGLELAGEVSASVKRLAAAQKELRSVAVSHGSPEEDAIGAMSSVVRLIVQSLTAFVMKLQIEIKDGCCGGCHTVLF